MSGQRVLVYVALYGQGWREYSVNALGTTSGDR